MIIKEASPDSVMERCDILSRYTEEPHCLTRPFASKAMRQANETVARWMQAAGMDIQYDAIGNLIGRYEGQSTGAKTLLLGSHLDTVRDAGKYDGILGVLIALSCVERLHQHAVRLPFAIEIIAFADEEGLRYHTTYLGSKAVTGTFDLQALRLTDIDGISMTEAIHAFGGNADPNALRTPRWQRDDLLGYCEVHIEQGPVLEAHNLPVGVVSAIGGQSRINVCFKGEAGHAGTVPMSLRHDALCASAEFIQAVEIYARSQSGLVATVGQVSVQPGACNVIPGQATLSLDVRHHDDTIRERACRQLEEQAHNISVARGNVLAWEVLQEHGAAPCAPCLTRLLAQAIEESGYVQQTLASGAGHDAAILSQLTDIAMLFVRCRGGISHHPAESVTTSDVAVAIKVLERFLQLLAEANRVA